jgi:ribonuclease HI
VTEAYTKVDIYTDGGCDPNPGPGGWAAVLIAGLHTKELSGAEPDTTNNRMELTAAIEALRALKRPCAVTLYTDSQYLRRGITEWVPQWQANDWRRANGRPVENVDLWQELVAEAERHRIEWHWVRGHHGNPLNERADELATQARRQMLRANRHNPPSRSTTQASSKSEVDIAVDELPQVELYTRGCALGVPGPGGYAAVLAQEQPEDAAETDQPTILSGAWPSTTNNVMELWAVIAGLRALDRPTHVVIHTVSKYLHEGATRWLPGWERRNWITGSGQPVKHQELWRELVHVMGDHDIEWRFLPVHKRGAHSAVAARVARAEATRIKTGQGQD